MRREEGGKRKRGRQKEMERMGERGSREGGEREQGDGRGNERERKRRGGGRKSTNITRAAFSLALFTHFMIFRLINTSLDAKTIINPFAYTWEKRERVGYEITLSASDIF